MAVADADFEHEPHLPIRERGDRWELVFDVLVFQVKLALDAMRDFLLSPLSFIALGMGLLFSRNDPYRYFAQLLHWGRRSEHVINLFGTSRVPYHAYAEPHDDIAVDRLFGNVEELLRRNVDRNERATAAKAKVDATIDELEARLEKLRAEAKRRFNNNGTT